MSSATTTPGPAASSSASSSRFNRLINKLAATTPARNSNGDGGALYDNDEETPLRPPVFESRFMRELEGGAHTQQRPPLGASHSSPAAVNGTSTSGGSIRQRLVRVASSGSLFGGGGSPSPTSSSSQQQQQQSKISPTHRKTTSLLVGSSNTTSPSPRSRGFQLSGSGHQHRHSEDVRSFTACADSPSHSPRLRPTNLLGTKDANASSNTLTAGLSAQWNKSKESLLSITSNGERAGSLRLGRKRSMDGLSTFSNSIAEESAGAGQEAGEDAGEGRPASSLSVATTNSRSSVSSSSHAHSITNTDRPTLGTRLLSSDRVPLDSSSFTSTYSKSTPGNHLRAFPAPSTAGNGNSTGLASGLSESSKRFRSAFRLNKSRTLKSASVGGNGDGTTPAPGTGGVRRAMRAPRRAQKEDEENNEEQEGEGEQAASMLGNQDSQSSSSATATPEDASTSIRSDASHYRNQGEAKQASEQNTSSSPDTERPMPVAAAAASSSHLAQNAGVTGDTSVAPAYRPSMAKERELQARNTQEQAQERAQLVLDRHIPLASAPAGPSTSALSHTYTHSVGALTGSMRARRAPVQEDAHSSPDVSHASAQQSISPEASGESSMLASHGLPRANQHQRQSSRRGNQQTSLEDLMLIPSSPPQQAYAQQNSGQKIPSSTSAGSLEQVDSDTLTAAGSSKAAVVSHPRRALRERDDSHNVEEILEAPPSHVNRHAADDKENMPRAAPSSPPMLGYRPKEAYSSREKLYPSSSIPPRDERPALSEIRKPLQPHSLSTYQLPTDQPRLGAAVGRANKASSTSVGSSSGYHPSDRQVVVNDYAVPVKRSGDTPPDHHHYPYYAQHPPLPSHHPDSYHQQQPQQVQFPSSNSSNPPRLAPPSSSLPPVPQMHHQAQPEQPQPVMKRTVGTVTVKGKTYTRMGLLGRGGSSKVFRVSDKDYNVFALKKVDLGKGADSETYQSFLNEISLLERLKGHDRIIQLVASEVNELKKSLIMVMEIGEIDLNQLLLQEKVGKKQSMNFIRHTWEQMLEAVLVIHEEGIVHTDLKPANFVLVKGALKLIDFGIAKAIPNDTTNIARDQQIGTANYMSPEALSPHISNGPRGERVMKLGRPSDVWSLGCILYQIVYGHTPFGRIKNLAAKMNAIQTPGYQIDFPSHSVPCTVKGEPLPNLSTRVEEDLLKCMKACLRYEPKKRATIPELLEDRFLRRREGDEEGGDESKEAVGMDAQMVVEIIQKTLQWSNGRQVSKSEQERFMEAMLRQIHR